MVLYAMTAEAGILAFTVYGFPPPIFAGISLIINGMMRYLPAWKVLMPGFVLKRHVESSSWLTNP